MTKLDSIFLVDDDATQNFVNERLLRKLAVADELFIAQNGKIAIDLIHKHCLELEEKKQLPKLIFLDLNMPVLDGFGFLKAFEELDCPGKENVIIAVLTTSSNIKDVEAVRKAGIQDFFSKPLTQQVVTQLVDKYFKKNFEAK